MDAVNGSSSNTYLNLVQQATRRNTLTQVIDAKQSGNPVDVEQLQSSNQALRDTARETGVSLYSQQLQKQAVETYTNTSQNTSYDTSSDDDKNSSDVYTFDASTVNAASQTVQKRTLAVAAYINLAQNQNDQQNRSEFGNPFVQPVNVYV